jgi:hypothetical protein
MLLFRRLFLLLPYFLLALFDLLHQWLLCFRLIQWDLNFLVCQWHLCFQWSPLDHYFQPHQWPRCFLLILWDQ